MLVSKTEDSLPILVQAKQQNTEVGTALTPEATIPSSNYHISIPVSSSTRQHRALHLQHELQGAEGEQTKFPEVVDLLDRTPRRLCASR